jgi:uncharacterized protein with NAD-binding domain and iron-sulfur cluster
MPTVAIFGAGVAGLTAAQELAERGYGVTLYEAQPAVGGKARSFGKPHTGQGGRADLPGEHGFRFYPGFYKHVPDTMSRIPFRSKAGNVKGNLVSVPSCDLAFKDAAPIVLRTGRSNPTSPLEWGHAISTLFAASNVGLTPDDMFFFGSRMITALSSCQRRRDRQWEQTNWSAYIGVASRGPVYKRVFSDGLARPLVAIDPDRISARTCIPILLQILQDMVTGAGADRILNDPTTSAWLDPWHSYLAGPLGVRVNGGCRAKAIVMRGDSIDHVGVRTAAGDVEVRADHYVMAVPVGVMKQLLTSDMLRAAPDLGGISSLDTAWMTGFVLYLKNAVRGLPGHTIYADSPWALTSISELPFWHHVNGGNIGNGAVGTVFSVIISNWKKAGIVTGKPADKCTLAELLDETLAQLTLHLRNVPGCVVDRAALIDCFLDPAIGFDASGVVSGNAEELLVNTVGSLAHRPQAETGIANLCLAGDYVQTITNLATMEGACEAGRLAARGILKRDNAPGRPPAIFKLVEPALFEPLKAADDLAFPHGPEPVPVTVDDLRAYALHRSLG